MKSCLFILFTCINFGAFAQQGFIKNFFGSGSLVMQDMDTTHDGGYILCGKNYYFTGGNFVVIKTDSLGNEEWRFTNTDCFPQSNQNENEAYKIRETPQHDFVVISWMTGLVAPNLSDILFCKFDSVGNLVWRKQYDFNIGEVATALNIFEDSTYVLAGSIAGGNNIIIQVSYWGDTVWTNKIPVFNGAGFRINNIVKFHQKYYMAGSWDSLSTHHPEIICTDLSGNLLWRNLYPDSASIISKPDFRMSADKKLLFACKNSPNATIPINTFSIFKLDTLGNLLWQKLYHKGKKLWSDIFFNDSCLINYPITDLIDSINLFKYDLIQQENNNVTNNRADHTFLNKCVVNRKKEVVFIATYTYSGTIYSVLMKINASFIGLKNIFSIDDGFLVYPNPANDEITVEKIYQTMKDKNKLNFIVFDLGGMQLISEPLRLDKITKIKSKSLSPGVYTYQISSKVGLLKSGKLINSH